MNNGFSLWAISIVFVDLLIAVGAICALRYLQGLLAGVDTTTELATRDNYAFGISVAGGTLALALVLAGAVSGEASEGILNEAWNVIIYAIIGIVLLKVGTIINDQVIFHHFSLKQQVHEKNIAAGIVQAANLIALGLIINTAAHWVESDSWPSILSVIMVFFVAQVVLLAVTRLRGRIYEKRHNGKVLQQALENGNSALAIRYFGHLMSAAFGVKAASGLVAYHSLSFVGLIFNWLFVALAITAVISGLAVLARHAVLHNIDVVQEVDEQQNIGVASIEATLFIAVGLIVSSLLG
ncbi:DUF350 domain-containing protein [Candidatus Vondammii sp. HM_W22]|uniref:DUF350 domain-containing protein n=1 Tax=Candidatus Vondammii sp. HM_W22 TaxID=2687299 RepID=UPI001F12E020|nr:DUF350 domain-containing protein [Candidatus Vondammii sp. HM_W22]